jgi:DNA helicase-2/ATP-dependent DNA helicase PcrA
MPRLSKYQKQFGEAIVTLANGGSVEGKRHIILDAKAGSGKTFTITHFMKYIPTSQRVVAVMFNKRNADDIQPKLPATGHCKAMTTHSLGNRVLVQNGGSRRLDDKKIFDILDGMQMSFAERMLRAPIKKMVSIAKAMGVVPEGYRGAYGLSPDSKETWDGIIDQYAIDFDESWQEEAAINYTRTALRLSIDMSAGRAGCIDFDDMLFLPVIMKMPFPKYDWVFIDEAQDLSPIQHEIVKRSVAGIGGHLVAVGDPNQAIYQFRGAASNSMARLKADMDAHEMPLSICYRCDKAIIREAKQIVPGIEWQEDRAEGTVDHGVGAEKWAAFTPESAILCPFNAPLVATAFRLIRQKIACRVLGRDIGQGLVKLLEKLQADTAKDAERKLDEYVNEEMGRLEGKENKIQLLLDKAETLRIFLEEAAPNETMDRIKASIESLFADDARGMLTLSTIHRSKGAEYSRVFLLKADALLATTTGKGDKVRKLLPWEIEQKRNLLYVGITRAQNQLTYLHEEDLDRL